MIWLASYPRSGNTFFRAVLSEVYGIDSSEYHLQEGQFLDHDYMKCLVVKTHLLPDQLVPNDPSIPAVYIIRDGRDALVSMARQRKDMIAPESDYEVNLEEAVRAAEGSHFGGWSRNVSEWLKRADVVIRFEDLIRKPIDSVERLRPFMPDLPKPDISKLPTFQDMRKKNMKYNRGDVLGFPLEKIDKGKEKFFRRGKVGSWKDEMPDNLHKLFWEIHGETMKKSGYVDGLIVFRMRLLFKKGALSRKQRLDLACTIPCLFFEVARVKITRLMNRNLSQGGR